MVNIREVTSLLSTRAIQYIIGTICILILLRQAEKLFQLDENRSSDEPKNYRKRVGRIATDRAMSMLNRK